MVKRAIVCALMLLVLLLSGCWSDTSISNPVLPVPTIAPSK
ncbi:MAG TPA: hypothetical protein VFS21_36280 [Roseiflexaceae bacterium]|nr:hypothetical protein [Roseiflexaceae bacterium]